MIYVHCSGNFMTLSRVLCRTTGFLVAGLLGIGVAQAANKAAGNSPSAIPWNQIGAKAGADYQGDGLAVTPTESGARLHCVFQRLDGEATPEGLWLTSTVTNTVRDRFRVTAVEVSRSTSSIPLGVSGEVSVCGQTARFSRPGLTEEYSTSMDGVRQDFIVEQAPPSPPGGELVLELAVSGAQVEPAEDGARLLLDHSGRKIAYSRLRVTDATGKELPARIEVASADEATSLNSLIEGCSQELSLLTPAPASQELAVVVDDAEAEYPVRIDPTFSDANWVSMGGFAGANSQVSAAVIDSSGHLYIGGGFAIVGDTFANYIAEWNGSIWSPLGSGMNGYVNALAVSGGTLYAGGGFTTAGGSAANNIAQWNGTNWSALSSGVDSTVDALAVSGDTLYAGGFFERAGGSVANYIAQWNGTNWSALGSGVNSQVNALAVSGNALYAGGYFTSAGGAAANYIAKWNGISWSALGSGMNDLVNALAVSGGTLYAGGFFATAGGNAVNNIAKWNGGSWSALGSGINGEVIALAVSGSALYAGGAFTTAGGAAANNIAKWNGSSWSALGSGISGADAEGVGPQVSALAVSGNTVYAGGEFTSAGGAAANYIARWNGSSWSALSSGLYGLGGPYVYALAVSGSTLYAGGIFTTAGRSAAKNIAQWNGANWSALGSGIDPYGVVLALAVSGDTVYASGGFTNAGGKAADNIAQWNGSSWQPLGSGMSGGKYGTYVNALAVSGSTLYAGGTFTNAGGSAANNIAQWNGSSWSPLGLGTGGGNLNPPSVLALAVSGSTLYAAGAFTTAGGNTANSIAQWNGNTWSALGSGISGPGADGELYVDALAVSGNTLYAGGIFTTAGAATNANDVAQWDGSSWSVLGAGMSPVVYALAVSGNTLYAGGEFTSAGGDTNANNIAQWNGSSWSALGSGVNSDVRALAVSGGTMYVGGNFTMAGTNISAYAAMANLAGAPVLITTTNTAFGFTNGVFGFDVSGPSGASVVIEASTDLQTWIPLQTNLLGSGPLYFSDSKSTNKSQRFYRAQISP